MSDSIQVEMFDKPPTTQKERVEDPTISWPGSIHMDATMSAHSGCKAIEFTTVDQLNAFSSLNKTALFAQITFRNDGSVAALYTNTLTDDQIFVLTERSKIIEEEVKKRLTERMAGRVAHTAAQEAQDKELRKWAELGVKCFHNHKKKSVKENLGND